MTLILPWPPKALNPNERAHWAKKARYAKAYRAMCCMLTKQARVTAPEGRALLVLTFCPPDRRQRDDDNLVGAFKAGRDGVAQALKINDNRFDLRVMRGEPVKGGRVVVELIEAVPI